MDGTAVALLQKGQHGIDGVERQPIDGENLVARLQARFRRRHSGFDLADADGVLLHPGARNRWCQSRTRRVHEDWELTTG